MKMDKNNTNFPTELNEILETLLKTSKLPDKLFYYQKLAVIYVEMIAQEKLVGVKGLAIWQQMGLGKTILAIAIADVLLAIGYIVKIITPKSLQPNFRANIESYNNMMAEFPGFVPLDPAKFSFLIRSHTINRQIGDGDSNLSKLFEGDRNEITLTKIERNTVIIIDESHQITQLIANGSPSWIRFYDTIMRSPNAIIIPLSGSLISSSPFEIAPLINMTSGQKLFPESEDDFMKLFWDPVEKKIKNRGQFQNRCFGLISRMKLSYLEAETRNFYPEEKDTEVVRCEMSATQIDAYVTARSKEIKEAKFNGDKLSRPSAKRFESDSKSSTTYRVYSRQYSNFGPIPELIETLKMNKDVPQSKIIEIVKNTSEEYFHNGKFNECYKIVKKHKGRKGIILSQFTGVGGALSISEGFIRKGFKQVLPDGKYEPGDNFAVVNGSMDLEEQTKIIDLYNSPENDDGSIIRFIIGGIQQAMGLNLESGVYAIMYEPYWIYLIWDQFKKRINRYNVHERLPVEERITYPYILLSVYPAGMDTKTINAYGMKTTTDEHLYNKMIKNKNMIKEFTKPLEEVSIDCQVVKKNNPDKVCKVCNPNGQFLYTYGTHNNTELIKYDCDRADPCQTETEEIKAQKVKIDGETYYKVIDPKSDFGYLLYKKIGEEYHELKYKEMRDLVK
jgi:hypothetical protein